MATLSKHGRELLRIEAEFNVTTSDLITWERITRTYHADGKILEKRDVQFKPDQYKPNGERYSYGWKLSAKVKKGHTIEEVIETRLRLIREKNGASPWKVIQGGPKPVFISPTRIQRAIESGEYIGFCKDCGHSQDGCEPDARNYKCEHCGMMSVYGAEEMLMAG